MSGEERAVPEAEPGPGIHVVRESAIRRAWNGIQHQGGLSAANSAEWEHIVDYPSRHRPPLGGPAGTPS